MLAQPLRTRSWQHHVEDVEASSLFSGLVTQVPINEEPLRSLQKPTLDAAGLSAARVPRFVDILARILCLAFGVYALQRYGGFLIPLGQTVSTPCEPFAIPGRLHYDPVDAHETRWQTFQPKCRAPEFFRSLRNGEESRELDFLRNRTIVLIGDVIDRTHVEQFCQLMGQQAEVVNAEHPFAPPSPPSLEPTAAVPEQSLPRVCVLPKWDLTLISIFHYGLDQSDFFANRETYASPGLFEYRVQQIARPLVENVMRSLGRGEPDLVQLSSGTFDLERFAREDVADAVDTWAPLSPERLSWYRHRIGRAIAEVHHAFPRAKAMVWRSLHYPMEDWGERQWFEDQPEKKDLQLPPDSVHFPANRVEQLDQASRSLFVSTPGSDRLPVFAGQIRFLPWGNLMRGLPAHDGTHGTMIWGEMILAELKRAVAAPVRIRASPMAKLRQLSYKFKRE